VVTGAWGDDVLQAVRDLPVQVAYNPDWQTGQASSVRMGVQSAPNGVRRSIFLLPTNRKSPRPSCVPYWISTPARWHDRGPLVDGRRGNPVCFDRVTFPDLLSSAGIPGVGFYFLAIL